MEQLQAELDNFKQSVQSKLNEEYAVCKKNLKVILEPAIDQNPPDELKYGISTAKPDKQTIEKYLDMKLNAIIPKTEDFVKDMVIRYQFKDVTYETLHEESFIASLHKVLPHAGLPEIPIDEYKAAPVKK